jgi:hypothetical protein
MRGIYRALSLFWLLRAASRGPGALVRYLARRAIRRATYRALNRAFRVTGLYGRRRRRNITY